MVEMAIESAIYLETAVEQPEQGGDLAVEEAVRVLMSTGAVRIKILMNSKQRLQDAFDTLPACLKFLAD